MCSSRARNRLHTKKKSNQRIHKSHCYICLYKIKMGLSVWDSSPPSLLQGTSSRNAINTALLLVTARKGKAPSAAQLQAAGAQTRTCRLNRSAVVKAHGGDANGPRSLRWMDDSRCQQPQGAPSLGAGGATARFSQTSLFQPRSSGLGASRGRKEETAAWDNTTGGIPKGLPPKPR